MSNKKNSTSFTQASLLAREEKVLQDAEIVITTQRARIGELRSELERLNAEKIYWSNTHMKEMSDVIQENTKLRLQLDEMQADLNALRHTQDSTDNLITNLTEALGVAESQLLAQENELKSLRGMAGNLPIENNHLREENQRLTAENEKLKRQQEENSKKLGETGASRGSDSAAIQAVNASLSKHAKLARDLDFRTEELRVNKMCLLQLESDLLEHQLLVEQQRVEIQRLNIAVEALNREKALVPPVVITSRQFDSFSQMNDGSQLQNMSAKQFAEQIVSEITKSLPKVRGGSHSPMNNDENLEFASSGSVPDDIDIVQYRTMEEQRMLISRLLKGLDQLGFTRSDATCYKERASDYRWFYSSVVSHSVTYSSRSSLTGPEEGKDNISPPGFFNLFVRVESGNIAIFQNMEEEVPLFSIKPWKCNLEIYENSRQFVLTRTSTSSDQVENHILFCQTEDEFNRWYYALSYGGFIHTAKVPSSQLNKGEYVGRPNINDPLISGPNGNGNIVISVKIMDSEGAKNYKTTQMSIYNNHLSFSSGRSPIDTSQSRLSIIPKKSLISVTELSGGASTGTIFITSEDLREYENLKGALIACQWMEVDKSVGLFHTKLNTKTNNSVSKIPEVLDKKLVPQSINFSTNNVMEGNKDEDHVPNLSHGVILVKDHQVLLYHDEADQTPFARIQVQDSSIECDRRKMSILLIKVQNKLVESFYYMFSSLEEFNRSWSRLREGGIRESKPENRPELSQMCVVCKNKMHFYKNGQEDLSQSAPFLTISPDDTNCHIDSDRNEIILLHSQSDGARKKIILDCANMDEFTRWNTALQFGGFTSGVTRSCMSKYTFGISLFGIVRSNGVDQLKNFDTRESKPTFRDFYNITDYQSIEIFNSSDSKSNNKPLFTIPFKDTEYHGDAKKRQIIFLTRRGKAGEVRVIINMQTLSNFDTMNRDLINVDFPLLETNSATSLKAEYIIGAKEGILCIYCTKNKERLINLKNMINENKYLNKGGNNENMLVNGGGHHIDSSTKKFPECGYIKYPTSEFMCVASRAGRSVVLRRKLDDYDALSVRCKSLIEYEKWERSMSIAGFINTETLDRSFLPPITYLFHSLDYDYRKQPILPSLEPTKAAGTAYSDASIHSQDEASLLDEEGSKVNMNRRKVTIGVGNNINKGGLRSANNNLEVPTIQQSKLLDSAGIHGQSPPTRIILGSSRRQGRFKLEDLNEGFETDEWGNISEIITRDELLNKNEQDLSETDLFDKVLVDMEDTPEIVINMGLSKDDFMEEEDFEEEDFEEDDDYDEEEFFEEEEEDFEEEYVEKEEDFEEEENRWNDNVHVGKKGQDALDNLEYRVYESREKRSEAILDDEDENRKVMVSDQGSNERSMGLMLSLSDGDSEFGLMVCQKENKVMGFDPIINGVDDDLLETPNVRQSRWRSGLRSIIQRIRQR
ncbi:hypothetical protein OJ253_2490 [Cryptosporidium canis]|uniref:Uncharacterized protein n=1 Tax=Cryptosporidium canis TaxID=195482 RepID=A0A9D5DI44_9CRYT|nr:hypothetical protein OJ253_2490 [Cryptosporidium canis]